MKVWSAEIKELQNLHESLKGKLPDLEKELEKLVKADDENMVLIYSRRCLEVIITDLCECELKRPRKTEPLKGIIDKLNKEEKVPSHIIASMQNLNNLSTFGAHPKEFDPRQVKPVLINLTTILEWYLKYKNIKYKIKAEEPVKVEIPKKVTTKFDKRILRIGALIIVVLVVIVIILAYPKIFKGEATLRSMTIPAAVVNEFGEKEIRRVFKEEYVSAKLKVFPFKNVTNDSTKNWVGFGIREALYEDFLQFNYMLIDISDVEFAYSQIFFKENYYDIYRFKFLREQIKNADENNCPYFLTGTYQLNDGYYEITSKLYQTKSGAIEKEKTFKGKDLFELIDSISLQTRIDIGVTQNVINSTADLPVKDHMTNDLNAFRKYIEGLHDWSIDSNYKKIYQAIEMDTTFVLPLIHLSFYNRLHQVSNVTARRDINHVMRHRDRLSEYRNIETKVLYYQILGEIDKAANLMVMNFRLHPYNITILEMLWDFYDNSGNNSKAVETAQQLNKLVPDYPKYQLNLVRSYQLTGQLDKGLKIIEKLLEMDPENITVLLRLGKLYLHKNDYDAAEEIFENLILQYPEKEWIWSLMLDHIAFARANTIDHDFITQLAGNYIFDFRRMIVTNFVLNNQFLVYRATTQGGLFFYPVSDTEFVFVHHNMAVTHTYIKDKDGKIFKLIFKVSYSVDPRTLPGMIVWKQDSLIVNAEKLLQTNQVQKAYLAFQKAYAQNPEHIYLANFIQHLEFLQSPEYEKSKSVFNSYSGSYTGPRGDLKIFNENDRFFYENSAFSVYELLPLTEELFMFPDRYGLLIQFVKENNSIIGFKIIYRDGREPFFPKTN